MRHFQTFGAIFALYIEVPDTMKGFALTSMIFFLGLVTRAQIQFNEHPVELKMDVAKLDKHRFPEAKSSCAGEISYHQDAKVFSGGCAGVWVVTTTATDACGNTASTTQFISLSDKDAPRFAESSFELRAQASGAIPLVEPVAEDDSRLPLTYSYADEHYADRVVRTWKVSDSCGNTANHIQTIWKSSGL